MNRKQLTWRIDALMQQMAQIKENARGKLIGDNLIEYLRIMDEVTLLQAEQTEAVIKQANEAIKQSQTITRPVSTSPNAGPGICARCKFNRVCGFVTVNNTNAFKVCPRKTTWTRESKLILSEQSANFLSRFYRN